MNRLLSLAVAALLALWAMAQEQADIEVGYTFEFPNFKTGERTSRNRYILLANAKASKFYSPRTEYIDSLTADPDGKAKLAEMQRAALLAGDINNVPRRDGSFYVYKSSSDGTVAYYDVVMQDYLCSLDPMDPIDWQLADTAKTVLGYECMLATADYHGRRWNAWFAPDIPLQEGPWKLCGLPGLILEAESDDGLYLFTATGLQAADRPITPVPLADRYEKMSRQDLLRAKRAFQDNPLGSLNAQTGGNVEITVKDENGNTLSLNQAFYIPREQADFLETDY